MLNKKMNIILLFLFIFMAGCDKKRSEAKEKRDNPENIQSKTAKENIFSNNSIPGPASQVPIAAVSALLSICQ